jgi:hypothetical protein
MTGRIMDRMPVPGDLHGGFFIAPDRCFRMVYSDQLQATHCYEKPAWKGNWKDRLGKMHLAWACERTPVRFRGRLRLKDGVVSGLRQSRYRGI